MLINNMSLICFTGVSLYILSVDPFFWYFYGLTLRLWREAPENIYSVSRSCVNVVLGAVLAGLIGLLTAPP